jgi:PAS domain S-box-containing protein
MGSPAWHRIPVRGIVKASTESGEQELRATVERLERALDVAEMGIWNWYPQNNQLVASARTLALLGYGPRDFTQTMESFQSRLHPDDRERVEAAVLRALHGRDDEEIEFRSVGQDGVWRWLLAKGRMVWDAEGQPLLLSGTLVDVTARKRDEWAACLFTDAAAAMAPLDAAESLRGVTCAIVARFADVVIVQTQDASGERLTEVAASSRMPTELPEAIRDVWSRYPPEPGKSPWDRATLVATVDDDALRRFTRSEEHLAFIRSLKPRSFMAVPLNVRGNPVGVLALARFRNVTEPFDQRDLDTFTELARRISTKLDTFWLFRAEQRGRARFQALTDATSQFVWTADPRGIVKEPSESWRRFTGGEEGTDVGEGWLTMVHPEDHERVHAALRQALPRGSLYEVECRFRRPDGAYRWMIVRGMPVRDMDGRIIEWVGVNVDVQDQRDVSARLEESEARYRRIVETANEGIWTVTLDGRTTFANRRMAEILETTVEDLLARSVFDFLFPEDVVAMRETLALRGAGHKSEGEELRLRSASGHEVWTRRTGTPLIGAGGRAEGFLGLVTDITDVKRADRYRTRYQLLAKHARDVVMFISPRGRILEVNDAAVRIYGYTHAEMLTLSIYALRAPETHSEIDAQLRTAAAEGILFQTTHVRRDGSRFPVEVSAQGVWLDGEPLVLSVVRDITVRRRAEEQRDQTDRFRELFIGVLGHDLRSPLSSVLTGSSLLLRRADLPDADLRTIRRIHSSGQRMARMIEQILDFARARLGGGIPIATKPLDLRELLAHVVEELGAANEEAVIILAHDGVTVGEWDGDRLAEVFSNLIHNAIQYGRGEPIHLTLRRVGDEVVVRVRNAGEPIDPSFLPVMFDPFRHAEKRSSGRQGGLGLGLYIAKQIVEGHGGRISVESQAGEGTTFEVVLPAAMR